MDASLAVGWEMEGMLACCEFIEALVQSSAVAVVYSPSYLHHVHAVVVRRWFTCELRVRRELALSLAGELKLHGELSL